MKSRTEVWVFIEQQHQQVHDVSLELLGKARELAAALNGQTAALLLGHSINGLTATLQAYGADLIYVVDDPHLAEYTTLTYARAAGTVILKYQPEILLFGATYLGRDLAPRIASALKTGLTADCTDLQIGDYQYRNQVYEKILYQIRPAFGGNIIATIVNPEHRPQMATVREGVMKMAPVDHHRQATVFNEKVTFQPTDLVIEVLKQELEARTVNLKNSQIIVTGGYGVGSSENFQRIRQLAEVLGGEVGATRAAVDAGFIGKDHQIGQTGTTVRPKLYIAVGVSGAVQHTAGMQESAKIMAINSDPDAPIFKIAHYGIVGDLNEVLPKLIELFKKQDATATEIIRETSKQ
ncbi:electron transfer flavoprotein subunit alpha/FixB family protein [candidate division KSB1 bacterium]|nr:electron transfer flavoprotein subunit alpha/FixB family protein [candidate division KSB1 bacterium]